MNAAPIRAELTRPIASPPARWAIRATASGNTGATQSTWKNRTSPKLQASHVSARSASRPEEEARNEAMALRSPRRSANRGAASDPRAAPTPEAKMINPPISSVLTAATPSGGRIWGSTAVRKNTWTDPASTRKHATKISPQEIWRRSSSTAAESRGWGTPHWTSPAHPQRIAPPRRNDGTKPMRAAATAPASGPRICPTVIADWIAETSRPTSRSGDRPVEGLGVPLSGQPSPAGRGSAGDKRRDPQDPAGPPERGDGIHCGEPLDVEG